MLTKETLSELDAKDSGADENAVKGGAIMTVTAFCQTFTCTIDKLTTAR